MRRILVSGVEDLEAITHVHDDWFVLTDERQQQLILVRVTSDITALDATAAPRLGLGLDLSANQGFEGVSWDYRNQPLLVAREKQPVQIVKVQGFPDLDEARGDDLQISDWGATRDAAIGLRDVSSLTLHEPTGHLLLLSHESRAIAEYTSGGALVGLMLLWRGWHGLAGSVPQAEGIAIGPDRELFVLSGPNPFYRFEIANQP